MLEIYNKRMLSIDIMCKYYRILNKTYVFAL